MKHRGRSPASSATGAKARDTLRSGTGSSGRSIASDHDHDDPMTSTSMLVAATSTLAAATAEESLTIPGSGSLSSSNVSPSHHSRLTLDQDSLGNSIFYDDPDLFSQLTSATPDPVLTAKAIDHYQGKIGKTKEQIKDVQTSLDENVNEYLKLSANATDGIQQQRIKQVFEKKNQKSAQQIAQLQKKLDEYSKKVRHLEKNGLMQQKPKIRDIGQGLKHVGGNIRDGISGMSSTVMSKPKEFANFVLGHNKYGSADNLSSLQQGKAPTPVEKPQKNSSSLPRENSGGGGSSMSNERQSSFEERRKCLSEDGGRRTRSPRASDAASEAESSHHGAQQTQVAAVQDNHQRSSPTRRPITNEEAASSPELNMIMQELTLQKEEVDRLREEMDELRQQCKAEVESLTYKLLEERESFARLEEQINDLTELHQHEIENIKSGVSDMEEKVQYQSEERLLDIKEHLQTLETKVTSMEHQQVQQQYLNIEGLDSTDARAIMMKLLNALITFIHVILFFIGTFMNLTKPFLRTTLRMMTTIIVVIVSVCAYYHQDAILALVKRLKKS